MKSSKFIFSRILYLVDYTRALLIIASKVDDIEIMSSLVNVARGNICGSKAVY
ncbi:TENA/THI-4/PQQC family protein [Wolbachia endosymbiont of Trichogramma pretiosum]|nr:TENA/THI-4/PQQC family protein [Wolbachia endosymbiont of Trichogramma pretiosum]